MYSNVAFLRQNFSIPLGQLMACALGVGYFFTSRAVWPDLEKIRHFGKTLQVFVKFFTFYLLFGKILSLLLQIWYIIGLIFIVAIGQIFKNNLTIWSHCIPASGHTAYKLNWIDYCWQAGRKSTALTFVGIHSRRTDYVKFRRDILHHRGMRKSYFFDAIEYFNDEYDNVVFAFVSDDMIWGRKKLKGVPNVYFVGCGDTDEPGHCHSLIQNQCDPIGQFLTLFETYFHTFLALFETYFRSNKSCQNIGWLLGYFQKRWIVLFEQTSVKYWFIRTSLMTSSLVETFLALKPKPLKPANYETVLHVKHVLVKLAELVPDHFLSENFSGYQCDKKKITKCL